MIVWWLLLSISSPIFGAKEFDWLFYATRKYHNSGDYDCILYDNRFFCRRDDDHEAKPCVNGLVRPFSSLKTADILPHTLINWNIPFDEIEQYADYLISNMSRDKIDHFICNCTARWIGPSCEYERPLSAANMEGTILNQLSRLFEHKNEILTCLIEEIRCNTGLLCLEWRQICDGIIQCDDGSDEMGCDLLEFNHCNKDEYQCRNGMCIPLEFLFDATFDCMDASDEQENVKVFEVFNRCPIKSAWECDERLCHKNEFSCGDGQCIHWSNLLHHRDKCKHLRDIAYHCEMFPPYGTLFTGICRQTNDLPQYSNISLCVFNLKSLLRGMSRKRSRDAIIEHCPDLIQNPEQAILSPVVQMFFNKSRLVSFYNSSKPNFHENLPKTSADLFCLNGSLLCNGTQTSLRRKYCWSIDEFEALDLYPFFPIPYLFCQAALGIDTRQTAPVKRLVRTKFA